MPTEDAQRRSADAAKAQDGANEDSPLLAPSVSDDNDDELTLVPPMPTDTTSTPTRRSPSQSPDIADESARSTTFLFFLTLSMLG